jgi:hypothetical protein
LDKYNPEQFEILGQMVTTTIDEFNFGVILHKWKRIYARIIIGIRGWRDARMNSWDDSMSSDELFADVFIHTNDFKSSDENRNE